MPDNEPVPPPYTNTSDNLNHGNNEKSRQPAENENPTKLTATPGRRPAASLPEETITKATKPSAKATTPLLVQPQRSTSRRRNSKSSTQAPDASDTSLFEKGKNSFSRIDSKFTKFMGSSKGAPSKIGKSVVSSTKVLSSAVDYVNRKRKEIKQLNKYNRLLHAFFVLMVIALVCLILNLGSTLQHTLVEQLFTLAEGKLYYNIWTKSRQPITTSFYIFNVTNPDEILKGAVPKLQELGPYTYEVIGAKKDPKAHSNKKSVAFPYPTISYKTVLTYTFMRDQSKGELTDKVVHLNTPGIEMVLKAGSSFAWSMNVERIFLKHTVDEWLWGYEQEQLSSISSFADRLLGAKPVAEKYGIMASLGNNTVLPESRVYQGVDSDGNLEWGHQLEVAMYGAKTSADCWANNSLNQFTSATEGTGFGPFSLKVNDHAEVYRSEFKTKINYTKTDMVSKYLGLLKLKILEPEEPVENKDFCANTDDIYCGKGNWESGVCDGKALAVSKSMPHFYLADPKFSRLFSNFSGKETQFNLKPDKEKHQSQLGVDPITGLTWIYKRRFQANVGFGRSMRTQVKEMAHVHKDLIYLPLLWTDMSYELPAVMNKKPIAFLTFLLRAVIPRIWLLFFLLSLIFLMIPTVQRYVRRRKGLVTEGLRKNKKEGLGDLDFDETDHDLFSG